MTTNLTVFGEHQLVTGMMTNLQNLVTSGSITSVVNRSDELMNRVFVTFANGRTLSIVRGPYSYGGKRGLFEIMPSESKDFDKEDQSDGTVLGWCSVDKVNHYILKLANL